MGILCTYYFYMLLTFIHCGVLFTTAGCNNVPISDTLPLSSKDTPLKEERKENVIQSLKKGQKPFEAMLTGQISWRNEDIREELKSVINFLYAKAFEKGQRFDQGTYVVEVNESFLKLLKSFPGVYKRFSSHAHPGEQKNTQHYGFDFKVGDIYPMGKKHILFFSLIIENQAYCFLKPENHGVANVVDTLRHGHEYMFSIAKRVGILNAAPKDGKIHRKERVKYLPICIKKLVEELKNKLTKKGINDVKTGTVVLYSEGVFKENYKNRGISYITECLKECESDEEYSEMTTQFKQVFEDLGLDHLAIRLAQEVILTRNELLAR